MGIFDSKKKNMEKLKPVRASKEMLAADVKTLQTDPNKFGLSDAERENIIGEQTRAADAQRQSSVASLNEAALAGQPFQAGAFAQAARETGAPSEAAAAKAGRYATDLSRRMVEQRVGETRSALDAARERARENTRFWLQLGIDSVGSMMEFTKSVGDSLMSGGGAIGGTPAASGAAWSGAAGGGGAAAPAAAGATEAVPAAAALAAL